MQGDQTTVYCPYTDKTIPMNQASREHIVPMALGGSDAFQIPACRSFNSHAGSKVDGAMANDFITALDRTRYDARGHSGRKPTAHVRRAKLGPSDRPIQANFSVRDGLRIWDAFERRDLSNSETAGMSISFSRRVDMDMRLRFVAKVALSGGYFVYRDLFRENVRHDELRGVMNLEKDTDLDQFKDYTIRSDDPLMSPAPKQGTRLEIIRGICSIIRGSVVLLIPSSTSLMTAVGVLGRYVGMLDVDTDTTKFPNSAAYRWGHAIVLVNGVMKRCSFADLLKSITKAARIHASSERST